MNLSVSFWTGFGRVFAACILMFSAIVGASAYEANGGKGELPSSPNYRTQRSAVGQVELATLPDTIGIEHQDRVKRFSRLSKNMGVKAPRIDQMQLRAGEIPGVNYPVPIVRVIFDEKVFFNFNEDQLRREAQPILDLMAENMRRDVPDAQLLVLGHTDAIGNQAYNIDLSRRRAMNVIHSLIERGVDPAQLSAVAIGESQPIAPNRTENGRAHNRRVEFMLSAERAANLQLVHKRRIREEYLKLSDVDKPSAPANVAVIAPTMQPEKAEVTFADVAKVELQKPTPVNVELRKASGYELNKLDDEFTL